MTAPCCCHLHAAFCFDDTRHELQVLRTGSVVIRDNVEDLHKVTDLLLRIVKYIVEAKGKTIVYRMAMQRHLFLTIANLLNFPLWGVRNRGHERESRDNMEG